MPISSRPRVPSYRRHRPTGQAVVTQDGRDIYPGQVERSEAEHQRIISELLAAGRMLRLAQAPGELTVVERNRPLPAIRHAGGQTLTLSLATLTILHNDLKLEGSAKHVSPCKKHL